ISASNAARASRVFTTQLDYAPSYIAASASNLVAAGDGNHVTLYFPLADQTPVTVGGTGVYNAMAFNATGTVLAVNNFDFQRGVSTIWMWDVSPSSISASSSGSLISEPASFETNVGQATKIVFNSAGNILTVGGNNGIQGIV